MFKALAKVPTYTKVKITKSIAFSIAVILIIVFLTPFVRGEVGYLNVEIVGMEGNMDSLYVTIEEIQVKPAVEEARWEVVEWGPKTYEVTSLTHPEIIKVKKMIAGNYSEIRLWISDANVTYGNVTTQITVPSARLRMEKPFEIKTEQITTLTINLPSDELIVRAGNEYILVPASVKITSQI